MKITHKTLSIPPYVSTSWVHVRNLHVKDNCLIISLSDGAQISIPGLSPEALDAIFKAHAAFLEGQFKPSQERMQQPPFQPMGGPFIFGNAPEGENVAALRFSFDNMESIGSALHHNPSQAGMPNLPPEILGKIAAIAKIVAPEDVKNMPQPEPHCNCPHCQIVRAIHSRGEPEAAPLKEQTTTADEEVSDQELAFQQWDILQAGDRLFTVTNRLDAHEKYNVFLGEPVGCTCGVPGCEHILAVLKS